MGCRTRMGNCAGCEEEVIWFDSRDAVYVDARVIFMSNVIY
jgi:hypothetical protein